MEMKKKWEKLIAALALVVLGLLIIRQTTANEGTNGQIQTEKPAAGSAFANLTAGASEASESLSSCKEAYVAFLRNFSGPAGYDVLEFCLRDLDHDGIPELLVVQSNEAGGVLTVYSYNGSIYKMGDYLDSKIGVSAFVIPDNPKFYGLLNLWWGGGVEHYGYLTVKDKKLIYEDLYYIDRTGDRPQQRDISDDKELIDEAVKDFAKTDSGEDNTLDMYLINEENIRKIPVN